MVVLDQFYQIVERSTPKVSSLWKVSQALTFIVSALCGFTSTFTIGQILNNFNFNCILNSNLVFDNSTILNVTDAEQHRHRAIDLTMTTWGPTSDCNFAQFTPLFIMISAIVWGTFLIVLAKGGAGYPTDSLSRPWRFLYPCIIFTVIIFIIYLVSTLELKNGVQQFCEQFRPELNNTGCTPEINTYTHQFHPDGEMFSRFYPSLIVSLVSSDIGLWSWVVQLILCVTRLCCMSDFELQLVSIVSKDEEHIEKVTEFTENTEV